ncbi:sodium/potassium-transporting ATPase subunit beta-like [Elysia marginata]|uniref:Sodium/potassium-transporting ATPase subunit beta-like n=1 Tax=Elysia marginata TaxID=1093978 RepID=A0AAV4F3I8_9GAST|nr:sodium/potassium-transporting ATPase subunit beta-like [Elysia marginata]
MASQVSASAYSATSSALYQSTIASTGIQRETFADRLTQTKNWIYNAEENLLMGRSPLDWLLYIGSLFLFVCALIGMSAAFFAIFYWIVDWNDPTLQGPSSILQVPGLGFRPQPDASTTLIRFIKGDTTTYYHYLDHLEAYIQYYEYELKQGDNFKDCKEIRKRRTEELNKVCVFEVEQLGGSCVKQQNYGFDDGQPCVLLKMNRIYDWMPEEYTDETVPDVIRPQWEKNGPWWVHVVCDGDDPATRENMGQILIFPEGGFHFKYFPFRNQQGYRSPIAFLRFENPNPGILLMMTCKAFARNIIHNRVESLGQVSFEIMVD